MDAPSAVSRSLPRRLLDTFVAPTELFAEFDEHAPWLGPLLIAVLLGGMTALLIPIELIEQEIARSLGEAGGPSQPVAPEDVAGFARLSGVLGAIVAQPVSALLVAGALTLIFGRILGGGARYRQYLALTTHAMLIVALGGLLTLPLQVVTGDLRVQLSAALLVPALDPKSPLFLVLQGLNLFTIWALVVLALGVSVVDRRRSWKSATAILLALFLMVNITLGLLATG